MKFSDIETVGELIDALQHYPEGMPVILVYETYARQFIATVEARNEDGTDRVYIEATNK